MNRFRPAVAIALSAVLLLDHAAPVLAGAVTATSQRIDYELCQSVDESGFRQAIEAITTQALRDGLSGVDYNAAVADEWRRIGFDDILNKRVELAIAEVRDETSWGTLIQSLADKSKAQELAVAVAERVYRSEAVKAAIEDLATGVGNEVGRRVEEATEDAASPAIRCLKAFIGPRYGDTVAGIVSGDASREFTMGAGKGASVSPEAVLRQSGQGMAGAAILLMRKQLANMAQRVGQRIAGSVLSRLVSVVAGGVGLVLIAKDIWELRNGVLPIIAGEMKSSESKEKVREELAKSIAEQIDVHVKEIAAKSADRIVEIWHEFRRAHAAALDIASRNASFKSFLDLVQPAQFARLDEVTALLLASEGEAGILKRLENGTLRQAVHTLPEPAMTIARETRSVDQAISWNALAGDLLPQVIENEIYRRGPPDTFTHVELERILALENRLAIGRIAALDRPVRDTLFELPPDKLAKLARGLSEAELLALKGYLTGLASAPRSQVLDAIAQAPEKMLILSSDRVRDAIVSSTDQAAAVSMMLRPSTEGGPQRIADDLRLAWEGRINPLLIWSKHPAAAIAGLVAALLLLLLMRRLLFPRRQATA